MIWYDMIWDFILEGRLTMYNVREEEEKKDSMTRNKATIDKREIKSNNEARRTEQNRKQGVQLVCWWSTPHKM